MRQNLRNLTERRHKSKADNNLGLSPALTEGRGALFFHAMDYG
jgi:hypothetical protein